MYASAAVMAQSLPVICFHLAYKRVTDHQEEETLD